MTRDVECNALQHTWLELIDKMLVLYMHQSFLGISRLRKSLGTLGKLFANGWKKYINTDLTLD